MTPDQLIDKYIALRNRAHAMKKEYEAAVKPYNEGMEKIETFMLDVLNKAGVKNMGVEGIGTAYKTKQMQVTLADRPKLISYVLDRVMDLAQTCESQEELEQKATPVFECFTNSISKDWAKDYLEVNKNVPPGVSISTFASVGFRKA